MNRDDILKITRQALPILLFCALIQLGSGSLLGGLENKFDILPGLLVMVPPLLGLRGNINGALASRLSSGLHQGVIDSEVLWGSEVKTNLKASIFLTFMVSLLTGVLAFSITVLTGLHPFSLHLLFTLISVGLIAGAISGFGLASLTTIIAMISYRRGWDPDNITSPLMATIGDIVTVFAIYIAIFILV